MALFVRVVEAGSFSKAAAREAMPVSSVSRKIAELEKALGVRLLERSTRQLRMTEIGQGYFESCRRGLTEFEAADSLVTQRHTEISGRLRMCIPPSMSDLAIVPLVSAFQERYPKVTVHCLVTERSGFFELDRTYGELLLCLQNGRGGSLCVVRDVVELAGHFFLLI